MDDVITGSKLEERMVLSATERLEPVSGSFELTPVCNLHCSMCYVRKSPEECRMLGGLKPVSFWTGLAEKLLEACTLFLLLTGGEPFLYPGFRELYKKVHDMGFVVTLNTNGTCITPEAADFLAENMPRRVNVTLYGTSAETYGKVTGNAGAYEKTLEGIRNMTSRGIAVKMNVSLVKDNAAELEDFHRIAVELGIPLEVNTYMYPAMREPDDVFDPAVRLTPEEAAERELLNDRLRLAPDVYEARLKLMAAVYSHLDDPQEPAEAEPISCRAARSSFWVNWKGQMVPCVFLGQKPSDLEQVPFTEAWKRLTETRAELLIPGKCLTCVMRPFCLVCGAAAFHENGKMGEVPEYLCKMTREKLRLAAETQ